MSSSKVLKPTDPQFACLFFVFCWQSWSSFGFSPLISSVDLTCQKYFFFFFAVHCSFLRISIQCYALMPRTKLIFAVPSCGFLCSVMLSFLIMPSGLFVNQWTKERQKQNETNVRHSFHFGCCLGVPCRIMHIVTGRIHVCRRDRLSPLPPSLWYGPTLVRIIRTNTGPYYKDEHWSVL